MNSKKVISPQILPTRLPFTFTLIIVIFVKVFAITGVWLGVIITIMALYWIASVIMVLRDKHVDIFTPPSAKASQEQVDALVDKIEKELRKTKLSP